MDWERGEEFGAAWARSVARSKDNWDPNKKVRNHLRIQKREKKEEIEQVEGLRWGKKKMGKGETKK